MKRIISMTVLALLTISAMARYMTDDDHYKYVIGKMDTANIKYK